MLPRINTAESVPCWYEISWQLLPLPAILIRVHRDYISRNVLPMGGDTRVQSVQKYFGLNHLASSIDENGGCFGFGRNPASVTRCGNFFVFSLPLPDCQVVSGKSCESCRLGGMRNGGICEDCGGTGRGMVVNQNPAYLTAASIFILLSWLRFPEKRTSSVEPQLVSLSLGLMNDRPGGNCISGEISFSMREYLRALGKNAQMPAALEAAMAAFYQMEGRRSYQDADFKAMAWDDGCFTIGVPGSSAGLDAADSPVPAEGEGRRLVSHNLDTPTKLLAILAGLGALHDEARRWLHKKMRGA